MSLAAHSSPGGPIHRDTRMQIDILPRVSRDQPRAVEETNKPGPAHPRHPAGGTGNGQVATNTH